jgi:hypothetical protein
VHACGGFGYRDMLALFTPSSTIISYAHLRCRPAGKTFQFSYNNTVKTIRRKITIYKFVFQKLANTDTGDRQCSGCATKCDPHLLRISARKRNTEEEFLCVYL